MGESIIVEKGKIKNGEGDSYASRKLRLLLVLTVIGFSASLESSSFLALASFRGSSRFLARFTSFS